MTTIRLIELMAYGKNRLRFLTISYWRFAIRRQLKAISHRYLLTLIFFSNIAIFSTMPPHSCFHLPVRSPPPEALRRAGASAKAGMTFLEVALIFQTHHSIIPSIYQYPVLNFHLF